MQGRGARCAIGSDGHERRVVHNGGMPKISAPTVAEHRANRHAALVRAGEEVLREEGLAGVTPGRVVARAGLSRSSFYDYFASKDDLLIAIARHAIEQWNSEIDAALAEVDAGLPALRKFIESTMRMTADGRHDIANAVREANLSPSSMDDLMAFHDKLIGPVVSILSELGVPSPQVKAMYVQGLLNSGVQMVSHGCDPNSVADEVFQIVTKGVVQEDS